MPKAHRHNQHAQARVVGIHPIAGSISMEGQGAIPERRGAGWILTTQDHKGTWHIERYGYRYARQTTNNVAEYTALVEGLRDYIKNTACQAIDIIGDSQLILQQIAGHYECHTTALTALHNQAKLLLNQLPSNRLQHTKRERNKAADHLSNVAMDSKNTAQKSYREHGATDMLKQHCINDAQGALPGKTRSTTTLRQQLKQQRLENS